MYRIIIFKNKLIIEVVTFKTRLEVYKYLKKNKYKYELGHV